MTAFAYTIKNRAASAPECFASITDAVTYLSGTVNKPYKLRGSGNSPLYAHYNTGVSPQEVILDEYIVARDINTGTITNKLSGDIDFEQRAYNRVYKTERDRERERILRSSDEEWLFEKDYNTLLTRELEIKRWIWSGEQP